MKLVIRSFALALVLSVTSLGAGTVAAADPLVIPWPGSEANEAIYWETYFAQHGYTYTCTKFDVPGDFTTTEDHDAIVVKAGQNNYIWQPAPLGPYSAAQDVSHYFICDGEDAPGPSINPQGSIGGPCADPAYYAVFDNTLSTIPVKFRFMWFNSYGLNMTAKYVPAGAIWRTREHWATPGTLVRVGYRDPFTNTWVNLDKLTAVGGLYPACVYTRGWEFPNR